MSYGKRFSAPLAPQVDAFMLLHLMIQVKARCADLGRLPYRKAPRIGVFELKTGQVADSNPVASADCLAGDGGFRGGFCWGTRQGRLGRMNLK